MDVYSNPEAFGLTIVGEVSWENGGYWFDMTVVWKDGHGGFFYGHDSGCSCASPFENYPGIPGLKPLPSLNDLQVELNAIAEEKDYDSDSDQFPARIASLLEKLHKEGVR